MSGHWRPAMGAAVTAEGVRFRVWCSNTDQVEVELHEQEGNRYVPMHQVGTDVYEAVVADAGPGTNYKFRLDRSVSYPDPCSRFQPSGVHGPSQVVDPEAYVWRHDPPEVRPQGMVFYEVHVGAYTPEGSYQALATQLPELAELGVSAVELMPVHTCPGQRNWGYDGVDLYAPYAAYGTPDELRSLVDQAHGYGLAMILDVVYNHLGPEGNYLWAFSREYFTRDYVTPWGEAINMAHPQVREFFIQNALMWLDEFRFDGLRLDATFTIHDPSPVHVVAELSQRLRREVGRPVVLVAEDHRNGVEIIRREGWDMDMVWADDFHRALHVLLTGEHRGFYLDYEGTAAELCRCLEEGFLYQGEFSSYMGAPRGTVVTDEPAWSFLFCLQNHDVVGNRPLGERLHHLVDREAYKTASALLLLAPESPLLFMGQEFCASSPFHYFTDHAPELGRRITEGRELEFVRFFGYRGPAPEPQAEETFLESKLDLGERESNRDVYELYRQLLRLRREDPVLRDQARERTEARPLGRKALLLRRWNGAGERLLYVNFGRPREVEVEREKRVLLSIGGARVEQGMLHLPGPSASLLASP